MVRSNVNHGGRDGVAVAPPAGTETDAEPRPGPGSIQDLNERIVSRSFQLSLDLAGIASTDPRLDEKLAPLIEQADALIRDARYRDRRGPRLERHGAQIGREPSFDTFPPCGLRRHHRSSRSRLSGDPPEDPLEPSCTDHTTP